MADNSKAVERVFEGVPVKIVFPESARKYIGLQCNNDLAKYSKCPEFAPFDKFLSEMNPPDTALDLGAGLGRASVYLRKRFKWGKTKFFLLDGNVGNSQVAGASFEMGNHFYNSRNATVEYCGMNGLGDMAFVDASTPGWMNRFLLALNGKKLDFVYSLKAFGLHWPFNPYMGELEPLTRIGTVFMFEVWNRWRKEGKRWQYTEAQIRNLDVEKYKVLKFDPKATFAVIVLERIK